jgi:hypothetical protein
MADVRSMLRAERAARAPTKTPKKQPPPANKKRKAIEDDGHEAAKRQKAGILPGFVAPESSASPVEYDEEPNTIQEDAMNITAAQAPPAVSEIVVDEAEWAAFERDVVAEPPPLPPSRHALNTINSTATISAAPMTAAEIEARRKREDQNTQRLQRAEEAEAEKEDAVRNLEEEFEEMEALEARVRRLKEQRERLRNGELETKINDNINGEPEEATENGGKDGEEAEEADDDEFEDDWDAWAFGRP